MRSPKRAANGAARARTEGLAGAARNAGATGGGALDVTLNQARGDHRLGGGAPHAAIGAQDAGSGRAAECAHDAPARAAGSGLGAARGAHGAAASDDDNKHIADD